MELVYYVVFNPTLQNYEMHRTISECYKHLFKFLGLSFEYAEDCISLALCHVMAEQSEMLHSRRCHLYSSHNVEAHICDI
jgi:hypothetical protein